MIVGVDYKIHDFQLRAFSTGDTSGKQLQIKLSLFRRISIASLEYIEPGDSKCLGLNLMHE